MSVYQIKPVNRKAYNLFLNENICGKIKFSGWTSTHAEIIIHDKKIFKIEPAGMWSVTKIVRENDKKIIEFRTKWNGKIILKFLNNENDLIFIFKRKGIFKNSFILTSNDEHEIMSFVPDFKWSKFKFEFEVNVPDKLSGLDYLELLILTCLYCYYQISLQESSSV